MSQHTPRLRDYLTISAYAFALSFLWNGLGPLILPQLVERLVAADVKNTRLGDLRFIGLLIAVILQPLFGALSDRQPVRPLLGKRKPFMLFGTLFDLVFLAGLFFAPEYIWLVAAYVGLQFVSNIAHGAYQGFIPDLIPQPLHGTASGAKNLAEMGALIIASIVIATLFGAGQWGLGFACIGAVLLAALLVTLFGVNEQAAVASGRAADEGGLRDMLSLDMRRDGPFVWWLVSRFFMLLGVYFLQTYAFNFVRDNIPGVEPNSLVGPLLAIIGVLVAISVLPAGLIADRVGHRRMTFIAGALNTLGVFLFIFASGRVLLSIGDFAVRDIMLFAAPVGFGTGIFLVCNWALGIRLSPGGAGGKYLGISNLATAGAGMAAGLGGRIIDAFGYAPLFALGTVSILFGMALLLMVPADRPRTP
ncbi:MAG: MFS transporter [Chloroflexi bacterium]|nr:MFS transporter [Chloroflexota bacterium]